MGVQRSLYENDDLVFATKHQKESVLAPVFKEKLGVNCRIAEGIDTDQFGTFSGEIERLMTPLEAARKKNQLAYELTGCKLSVASEGSFGQHPHLFFATANEELLLFSDFERKLEIVETNLVTETNFAGRQVKSWEEANAFAREVGFPEHGLILKAAEKRKTSIAKGITDPKELKTFVGQYLEKTGELWLETDMRAHLNPKRMKHIGQVGSILCDRILDECPSCKTPGFGRVKNKTGLPCQWCGQPTSSILVQIWGCVKCDFQEEKARPDQKTAEDPMYCDYCNP